MSISGIYFSSFFQRVAVPGTIFNELQSAFALTASGVAALSTIYLYVYGGLQDDFYFLQCLGGNFGAVFALGARKR